MRIIGGSARGRRLVAPKGRATRPTSDRVRQSVFDVLGQRTDGLAVLDLFAGTGALGLEAVSRGAARATLVENEKAALEALEKNVRALGFEDRARVVRGDALSLATLRGPFDLVLADPPYAVGGTPVVQALAASPPGLLVEGARIVIEHARREILPEREGALERDDQRRYGDTMVSFYTYPGNRT